MTRAEIGRLLDGGPLPYEGFFEVFQAVGDERRFCLRH
jgi:hypothetical protein